MGRSKLAASSQWCLCPGDSDLVLGQVKCCTQKCCLGLTGETAVTLPRHRSSLPRHQGEVCLLKRATQRVLRSLQQPSPVDLQGWACCACPVLVAWYRGEADTEMLLNSQVDELLQADFNFAKQQVQHGQGVIRCSCRRVQDNEDRGCDGRTQVAHTRQKV